jgi:RNA polymerase sigma factor (sigma-70 family)
MELSTIQIYIKDLNEALQSTRDAVTEDQFKKLYQLEDRFSRKLKTVAGGKKVYKDFILFIRQTEGGIKTARQYFREREGTYVNTVNAAIDKNIPELMHKSSINFQFCKFAMENIGWNVNKETGRLVKNVETHPDLVKLYTQIKDIREGLINKYLHLALNKAKTYRRPGTGVLEFGDLIQIANEGLIMAVDKYIASAEGSAFHTMALGRIVAHLIASGTFNSAVTIGGHGNKKLYRIKRLLEKTPGINVDQVAQLIDESVSEVQDLLAASSYFSLDQEIEDSDIRVVDTIASPADYQNDPYVMVEQSDALNKIRAAFNSLTLIEKKVLILKGVKIEDFA